MQFFRLLGDPLVFSLVLTTLGLLVGSFINVVAYRLPIMLHRRWRSECEEYLESEPTGDTPEPFDLVRPGSRCPSCGKPIGPLENIPVISYLLLRGRCSGCKTRISPRYPLVELSAAGLALAVALVQGPGWDTAALILLSWALLTLTLIDLEHTLLPDCITLPFLWLGLLLNLNQTYVELSAAVIGAALGYMSLWVVYQAFKLLTGKEGMGYGDFKLLALFGAWLGWQMLPLIVLLSSLVGAVVGLFLILVRGRDRGRPIPFGPYLAAAGWIAMLWGEQLVQAYLGHAGL